MQRDVRPFFEGLRIMAQNAIQRMLAGVAVCAFITWMPTASADAAELGLKAGMNMATFGNNFAAMGEAKRQFGFIGGGSVAFRLTPSIALQTELLFSMKGARDVGAIDPGAQNPTVPRDYEWRLQYVEIPTLFRVSPALGGLVQPDLIGGAAVVIKTGATFEDKAIGSKGSLEELRAFDVGLVLGVGAHLGHGPVRYLIEGRYTRGLLGIYPNTYSGSYQIVNDVFAVLIGAAR
jgi:outer membrane protein with beta-barrel domain